MAAGQGFKTFATGEVLTASDVNGYLMQGVLVFASAAARDAAITSPQAGQTAYLKDTNTITSYSGSAWVAKSFTSPLTTKGDLLTYDTTNTRLPVGTDGQVLTAASGQPTGLQWATSASGSLTLISTTTLSGVTTTLSSIPQTYNSLFLLVHGVTGNTADSRIRISPNNALTFTGVENFANAVATYSNNYIFLVPSLSLRTSANNAWQITINNYTSSTNWKPTSYSGAWTNNASSLVGVQAAGVLSSNTAVTSLVLDFGGTNSFAGGTALLYGVK